MQGESRKVRRGSTSGSGEGLRTAVVLIHGIGNQAPLETLRSFVDAAWWQDPVTASQKNRQLWVKPADQTGEFELRRLTSSTDSNSRRTDFYEFYWAHMMEDTRFVSVLWWLRRLFWRDFRRVPENALVPWLAFFAALLALGLVAYFGLPQLAALQRHWFPGASLMRQFLYWGVIGAAIAGVVWWLRHIVFMQVVGDAARYLTADPANIAARSRIRSAGVSLLRQLQEDPRYDRVVVVGHSLGTVVGYDILSILWSEQVKDIHSEGNDSLAALAGVEEAAQALREAEAGAREAAREEYASKQAAYFETIRHLKHAPWKIGSFITMGSPLTYASFLLVNDTASLGAPDEERMKSSYVMQWLKSVLPPRHYDVAKVFAARMAERTLSMSPPLPDKVGGTSFSYTTTESGTEQVLPHHATVFAAVEWTNIFAPPRWLLWGDIIGGPVSPLFGPGVKDVKLDCDMANSLFAHTKYWDATSFPGKDSHLAALRAALRLH